MASVSRLVVGILAAWLLAVAPVEAAPPGRAVSASVFVDAFDVEQVPALVPGAVLQFSVFASPYFSVARCTIGMTTTSSMSLSFIWMKSSAACSRSVSCAASS